MFVLRRRAWRTIASTTRGWLVADDRDVVVGIEVAAAVGVDQPHAFAAHEVQRLAVEQARHRGADRARSAFRQRGYRPALARLATTELACDLVPARWTRAAAGARLRQGRGRRAGGRPDRRTARRARPARRPRRTSAPRAAPRGSPARRARAASPSRSRRSARRAARKTSSPSRPSTTVSRTAARSTTSGRPARVAEVDDPGHAAVVVDEDIRGAEVRMDDLGAEARPDRRDHLLVAVEGGGDQLPDFRVVDRAEHRPEPERVLDIPEHHPRRGRVPEPAQRPPDPRGHRAPVANRLVAEARAVHARPARQPVVHPEVSGCRRRARASRRAVGGRVVGPMRQARNEPRQRDRDPRVDLGNALGRQRLQVEPRRVLGRVRDLQDGRPVAVDAGTSGPARSRRTWRRPRRRTVRARAPPPPPR